MKSARRPAERAMASPIAPTSSDLHRRVDDWLFRHQMEPSTPSCGITRGYERRYDVHITPELAAAQLLAAADLARQCGCAQTPGKRALEQMIRHAPGQSPDCCAIERAAGARPPQAAPWVRHKAVCQPSDDASAPSEAGLSRSFRTRTRCDAYGA